MSNGVARQKLDLVDNVKFESPKGLGHEITPKMIRKSTKFIKENLN